MYDSVAARKALSDVVSSLPYTGFCRELQEISLLSAKQHFFLEKGVLSFAVLQHEGVLQLWLGVLAISVCVW